MPPGQDSVSVVTIIIIITSISISIKANISVDVSIIVIVVLTGPGWNHSGGRRASCQPESVCGQVDAGQPS